MKILTLSLLTIVLVGCKENIHPIDSHSRVIPLEQAEATQVNRLRTSDHNIYATYEKASHEYTAYQSTLFNKYARKNEELELSDDGKYVIARPDLYK